MRTGLLLLVFLASLAPAQVLIRVQQDNTIAQIASGGTVNVNATGVNQARALTVTLTYTGTTSINLTQAPQILGSTDFTITAPPSTASLAPNQSLSMQLRYLPTSAQQTQAELDIPFQEASVQTPPTVVPPKPGLVVVGLNGTAPDYALNYGFAVDGNIVNLPPGGVLPFSDTVINNTTVATLVLVNRGSGAGQILSASTTGDAFSLISLPLIPSTLPVGPATLQFQVRYRPKQVGSDSGTLTLTFEGGTSYTVNLKGRGIIASLNYELLPPEGDIQPISPSQVVILPATPAGQSTKVFIRMRNTGSQDVPVSAIAISGIAFQLADLPFLPLTVPPGDTQLFSILFTPAQAGRQTGRLRVGSDSFDLAGDGIGPVLSYSYRSSAGVLAVQPLGTVFLPGVQVGQSSTVDFTIRNTGTAPAQIQSSAIVADGKSAFSMTGLPPLPVAVAPNASITFTIRFSPFTSGLAGASLRIGADAFTLSGLGNVPPPLPDYTIQGPATVQPLEQPSLNLTLATPYSVDLIGTLTLSTESDTFANDPAVLFITGGKTATFTIAAGGTKAVFSNGATDIKFQSGTVAGAILATPAFTTTGGLSLTPDSPKQYRTVLASTAPRITGLSINTVTGNGFTVQIVGYATTRTLTKVTASIKGKSGFNFRGTEFTQDLSGSSFLWFSSQPAAAFGGQFVLQLPIALTTSDTAVGAIPPIQSIESITVTLTNERGTSNSVTTLVQ
jgi:hypothetical protein